MITRRSPPFLAGWLVALTLVACSDPASDPTSLAPNLHRDRDGDDHGTVVVDPSGRHGRPTTITAGIVQVPVGGRVLVLPGTYREALVIDKGLTLQGIWGDGDDDNHGEHRGGHQREGVVISPSTTPTAVINVTTTEPVAVRGVTVQGGPIGIRATGIAADLTVERTLVRGFTASAVVGISVVWLAPPSAGPARLVVRNSRVEGGTERPSSGISTQGDVNAVIEGNVVRRTGTRCINVAFGGNDAVVATTVDVVDNDLDQCGLASGVNVTTNGLRTGTRIANVVGNTIRNSDAELLRNGVYFEGFTGRVEHNRIVGVVQSGANPAAEAIAGCCVVVPGAVFVGSLRGAAAATPVVRFNHIAGNAYAGLRIGPNHVTSLDARCNYWGSAGGPSGAGLAGTGDAVVRETGAAIPALTPFATESVADRRRHHGDHDDDDDDRHGRGSCRLEFSLWSAPVNLGTTINTLASEQNPNVSPDGLSLYLVSDRAGGTGLDIWVSQRVSVNAAWGSPVNLGSVINSPGAESAPSLSGDGRLLFFFSDYSGRPGAQGGQDLYVSRRADPKDDFAWGAPVNLGPYVNTAADEAGSSYVPGANHGMASLYFNRRPIAVPAAPYDIYSVPLTRDGLPREPATPIAELNSPAGDFGPEVSSDGREVIIGSGRPGTLGGNDLWVSIRRRVDDPWSTPENLGTPINTALNDRHPSLSTDARTLFFASTRSGTFGSDDLWISTRTRIGHHDR